MESTAPTNDMSFLSHIKFFPEVNCVVSCREITLKRATVQIFYLVLMDLLLDFNVK